MHVYHLSLVTVLNIYLCLFFFPRCRHSGLPTPPSKTRWWPPPRDATTQPPPNRMLLPPPQTGTPCRPCPACRPPRAAPPSVRCQRTRRPWSAAVFMRRRCRRPCCGGPAPPLSRRRRPPRAPRPSSFRENRGGCLLHRLPSRRILSTCRRPR